MPHFNSFIKGNSNYEWTVKCGIQRRVNVETRILLNELTNRNFHQIDFLRRKHENNCYIPGKFFYNPWYRDGPSQGFPY